MAATFTRWNTHALRSDCGRYSISRGDHDGWSVYLLWRGKEIVGRGEARTDDVQGRTEVVAQLVGEVTE